MSLKKKRKRNWLKMNVPNINKMDKNLTQLDSVFLAEEKWTTKSELDLLLQLITYTLALLSNIIKKPKTA